MLRKNLDALVRRCRSYPHLVLSRLRVSGQIASEVIPDALLWGSTLIETSYDACERENVPDQRSRPSKQKSNGGMKWASALHHAAAEAPTSCVRDGAPRKPMLRADTPLSTRENRILSDLFISAVCLI